MDQILDQRWRRGEPPFDGEVLVLVQTDGDPVPLAITLDFLRICRDIIRARIGSTTLFSIEDWHEHDGYVTSREPIDWSAVDAALQSEATLGAFCPRDDYVRRLLVDDHLTLCWRFWCDWDESRQSESESGADVSGPVELLDAIERALPSDRAFPVIRRNAKEYFLASWGG